jgi:hypothetical protein
LEEMEELQWSRAEISRKIMYNDKGMLVLRIGANRGQTVETKDFELQRIEDWPSALVVVNNEPTVQIMAIEVEHRAFRNTDTLAGILQENINRELRPYLLLIRIVPIFDKADFWQIVNEYKGRITKVSFDMVSPNMSNISASLKLDLHELNRSANVQQTTLELRSDKRDSLTLSPDNKMIDSLVDYSSQGGGNISIKIRDLTKMIKTSDSIKEINIGEIDVSANSPQQLAEAIKMVNGLMKQ